MTEYLGSYVRDDGYNGALVTIYLCADGDIILAVHPHGWFTW